MSSCLGLRRRICAGVATPLDVRVHKLTDRIGALASGRVERVEPPSLEPAGFRRCIRADKQSHSSARLSVDVVRTSEGVYVSVRCNGVVALPANGGATDARETTTSTT
jgi:hypothetical protein